MEKKPAREGRYLPPFLAQCNLPAFLSPSLRSPIFMREIYCSYKWKHAHFIFISENKGEILHCKLKNIGIKKKNTLCNRVVDFQLHFYYMHRGLLV